MTLPKWLIEKRDELGAKFANRSKEYIVSCWPSYREGFNAAAELLFEQFGTSEGLLSDYWMVEYMEVETKKLTLATEALERYVQIDICLCTDTKCNKCLAKDALEKIKDKP